MGRSGRNDDKPYHHGDLRSVLLGETARILREEGEGALSLRHLAAAAGVSRTAPYHHFKDKQGLLRAVAEEGFTRFNAAMKSAMKAARNRAGVAAMRDYVRAYVRFAVNNREYYDLMYGGGIWRSSEQADSLVTSARATLRSNIERIEDWRARGLVAADVDAVRFAEVAWGTCHGISRLLIDGIYTDSSSVRRLCDTAADTLWGQLDPDR